jgi:hypothetical protein
MKTQDVIHHFGTQVATAEALGMAQSSIAGWGEYPPDARQLQIEKLTRKKLKAEPGCLERLLNIPVKTL